MADIENKTLMGLIALIAGVYGWLLKHLSNSKKHPCGDNLVYKDVCQANRDCLETEVKSLKELMTQRFDNLEELVKNNGHSPPRVQT